MSHQLLNSVESPDKTLVETKEKGLPQKKNSLLEQEQKEFFDSFSPQQKLKWNNIDWVVLGWMVFVHAGALAAPFFFSWTAAGVCLLFHWLTCSIGICLGYHRFLSHRSLKLSAPAKFFVLWCGANSAEGTPLTWAATHRLHHQRSDQHGDPHSPGEGTWWSHMLWLFGMMPAKMNERLFNKYVPELMKDRMVLFFEKTTALWLVLTGVTLLGTGWWMAGTFGALSMLLWGMCLRMTLAYHSTWFVNSATHLWGYRNYETTDKSRNLWWVAIAAYGEGWHNNHHAHPGLAPAGHRPWEIDPTWWVIKGLRFFGFATDVKENIPPTGSAANDIIAAENFEEELQKAS